ncbi:hypothetical protein [Aeromonas phage 4_4512]|nr:hypothetical protein [Aeromonas phage 4_4512]
MSNETDLDWLARNVHVWKSGYDLAVVQRGGGEIYVTWPSACSCGITKKQWLARRAELQSVTEQFKPSIEEANRLAQEFKPFASIEDNQEREMKQDNRWFERGELPPVGAECEIVSNYLPTFQCEIVEYSDTQVCIRWKCDFSLRVIKLDLFNPSGFKFRPIRQDYQVIADIVRSVPLVENGYPERIADAILAAGFSLRDK